MPPDAPSWWYERPDHPFRTVLRPIAAAYGTIARRRLRSGRAHRAGIPVVCIGNFTAGGSGKTPLSRTVAEVLGDLGRRPVFLTRGYGGTERGPHLVDVGNDTAELIGDEALLLAASSATVVSRDRAAGARLIEARDAGDVIVMDDGMQNPGLAKDLVIAAIDGRHGIGNGDVIPAGPLRAPLADQLALVDAVVVTGVGGLEASEDICRAFHGPILFARTAPVGDTAWLENAPLLAFAGIGHPERFLRLLEGLGADVRETRFFADHHPLSDAEARDLLDRAKRTGLHLVTTEKDHVRLMPDSIAHRHLKQVSQVIAVRAEFTSSEAERMKWLLKEMLDGGEGRVL